MYKNIYARRLLEILQTGPKLGNSVVYITKIKKDEDSDKENNLLEKKLKNQ